MSGLNVDELAAELAFADGEAWMALDPDRRARYEELAARAVDYMDTADEQRFTIDEIDAALRKAAGEGPLVERLSEALADALGVEFAP